MIVVDTSALIAVGLQEASARACMAALEIEDNVLISAGTLAEALIVADRRNVGDAIETLVERLGFDVVPVTAPTAWKIMTAYARWGKGIHPAGLNFGDCFAYVTAKEYQCPLLYLGDDFSKTDIASVL